MVVVVVFKCMVSGIKVYDMLNLFHKMEFFWSVVYQGVKAIPEY